MLPTTHDMLYTMIDVNSCFNVEIIDDDDDTELGGTKPTGEEIDVDDDELFDPPDPNKSWVNDHNERMKLLKEEHKRDHASAEMMVGSLRKRKIDWKNISKHAKKVHKACWACALYNAPKKFYHKHVNVLPDGPMKEVFIDFAQLPCPSNGYTHFIVVVDAFSSYIITRPAKDQTSETTINLLHDIFADYGTPKIIHSDNGTNFTADKTEAWLKQLGITVHHGTPHNSKAQSYVERGVGLIKQLMSKYLYQYNDSYDNWVKWLPKVQLALNTRIHSLRF